jgi:hypothetical protein
MSAVLSAPSGAPCFIDPACEVARSDPDDAGAGMSYWPSYSSIGPRSRLAYLRWLAGGRADPKTNIGYVFLYFYGLERRLFIDRADRAEADVIVAEVARLRGIYGANNSFRGYSTGLLDTVRLRNRLDEGGAVDGFQPDLCGPLHVMPMDLKLAISARVAAGRALSFELAMAGLFGLEQGLLPFSYPVLAHARPQFLELMRPRFEAACPLGFKLAARKDSRLHLSHRCATADLVVDIVASTDGTSMPDPATLTWTKLIKLVEPVAAELEVFAKMKAYRPARVASLSAFTALPGGVTSVAAGPEAKAARDWLEQLPKPIAKVEFADLARRALGETSAKWTLWHHRAVGEALAATLYGIEPHPAKGGLSIADDTSMFVFRDPAAGWERTRAYLAAAVGAEVVAAVSRVDPATASAVSRTWLSRIGERLPLEPTEIVRLDARLRWLEGGKPSMGSIKAGLASVSETERETVAWSAATAAAAGGVLAPGQVSVLEKVYDTLGLTRRGLYTALHGAAADGARPATGPVPVARGERETTHAIPRPRAPAAEPVPPGGLDAERIRIIKAETERVTSVLASIFVEDEPQPTPGGGQPPPPVSAGPDASHARLIEALCRSAAWTRPDFEREARACGLMPDGALETINEWAFDRFGEPLVEEGDVITVNTDLLSNLREPENAE